MSARSKKILRDAWNLFFSRVPSRRVRRFFATRLLSYLGDKAFIALRVNFFAPEGITIGNRSIVNADCILDGREAPLTVGDNVDIGTHTHIWTLEHDPNDANHATKSGAVTIEDHAWIASRVTILPGVVIGRGAVVAAGSVVTRDVEPLAIVAGVPAKQISVRDNPLTYQLDFSPRFR